MKFILALAVSLTCSQGLLAAEIRVDGLEHSVYENSSESSANSVLKHIPLELPMYFGIRHAMRWEGLQAQANNQVKSGSGNPGAVAMVDSADLASKALVGQTMTGSSAGMAGLSLLSSFLQAGTYENVLPRQMFVEYSKYQSSGYAEIVSSSDHFDLKTLEAQQAFVADLGLKVSARSSRQKIWKTGTVFANLITYLQMPDGRDDFPVMTDTRPIGDRYWTRTRFGYATSDRWRRSLPDWQSTVSLAGYADFAALVEKAKATLPPDWTMVYYLDDTTRGVYRNGQEQRQAAFPNPLAKPSSDDVAPPKAEAAK